MFEEPSGWIGRVVELTPDLAQLQGVYSMRWVMIATLEYSWKRVIPRDPIQDIAERNGWTYRATLPDLE